MDCLQTGSFRATARERLTSRNYAIQRYEVTKRLAGTVDTLQETEELWEIESLYSGDGVVLAYEVTTGDWMDTGARVTLEIGMVLEDRMCKAGFTLRTQIYGAYADHFAHLGSVFSATNADLRRRDRAGGECKHSYNAPSFTRGCWLVIG